MVDNFSPAPATLIRRANGKRIRPENLEGGTDLPANAKRYEPIFTIESQNTVVYAPGNGPNDRQHGTGWSDLDLRDSNDNPIQGDARWTLYTDDSLKDPMFYSDDIPLSDLRAAVDAGRTDKKLLNALAPAGDEDRVLAFEVSPTEQHTGDTVDEGNSVAELGVAYSAIR